MLSSQKTKEFVDLILASNRRESEFNLFIESPKSKIDWLHSNFGSDIRRICEVDVPESMLITEILWEYFHSEKEIGEIIKSKK